nr:SUN domain-containing protein 1-like isoform X3 [Misgurnus anguillicaudatus]
MLRRSSRLMSSGYYLTEDDPAHTGSNGLVCRISYRETPPRRSHKGHGATPTSTSNSGNKLLTDYSNDGVYNRGLDMISNFEVSGPKTEIFETDSRTDLPLSQKTTQGFVPVYHLTDEQPQPSTFNDSAHYIENPKLAFVDILHSPDLVLALICCWLEKAWHTLNQNISRMQASYDFQFSRCSAGLRKAVAFSLILCLFCGLWYILPFAFPFHWRHAEILPPCKTNRSKPTSDNGHLPYEILSKMKNEITSMREREANMMKEITRLQLENEKQNLKLEMFQKDVTMQEINLESEYQQQISNLRSDVINIRETSNVLKQKLDMQNLLNTKDVTDIVQSTLSLYKSDGTGMADYALESSGGSIMSTQCSETYQIKYPQFSLFGIPLWYYSESPRTVIQPEVHPGKCWAFRGSKGFLTISLSYPIRITHVTLEHIPRTLSPTGKIDSAPKDFVVYGLSTQCDGGQLLGSYTYNQDEDPIQTFKMPESTQVYSMVELRILSNWGHPEYTCVYRFRVHGVPLVTNGSE